MGCTQFGRFTKISPLHKLFSEQPLMLIFWSLVIYDEMKMLAKFHDLCVNMLTMMCFLKSQIFGDFKNFNNSAYEWHGVVINGDT